MHMDLPTLLQHSPIPTPDPMYLRDVMVGEIFKAFGANPTGWLRQRFGHWFHKPTASFAQIGTTFDRLCAGPGIVAAARWALSQWASTLAFNGHRPAPSEGGLLVVSNHPGVYDALCIASLLGRSDLRIFAGDIPFLQNLPNACRHFIFSSANSHQKMTTIRQSIRHLESGGALLIYPSGSIDPDPAVLPGAGASLEAWSGSIPIMLRKAPFANVQVAIVSHVLERKYAFHLLSRLRKKRNDRQRVSEFLQVLHQLVHPKKLMVRPRVSFARPLLASMLPDRKDGAAVLETLVSRAKALLAEHASLPDHFWQVQPLEEALPEMDS